MSEPVKPADNLRPEPPDNPGLTIGISGPRRRTMAHRLINLALRLHGAHTLYIRPGHTTDVALLDGLCSPAVPMCIPGCMANSRRLPPVTTRHGMPPTASCLPGQNTCS